MRVAHDDGHPSVAAIAKHRETVGHVLVPLVQEHPRERGARPPELGRVRFGLFRVAVHLPLDEPGRNKEADHRAREQRDPFLERHRPDELEQGRPDRVIDQEQGEVALLRELGGDLHLGPGLAAADLRPEAALHPAPQPREQRRPARAPLSSVLRKERGGSLRVEFDRDPVKRARGELASQRLLQVDHVGGPEEQHRALGRRRVHGRVTEPPRISLRPARRDNSLIARRGRAAVWRGPSSRSPRPNGPNSIPSSRTTSFLDRVRRSATRRRLAGRPTRPTSCSRAPPTRCTVRTSCSLPWGRSSLSPEATALYQRFKDEEESASAGMGLFFTEG